MNTSSHTHPHTQDRTKPDTSPSTQQTYELVLFYDSECPLCAREMQHLKKKDHWHRIHLVAIQSDEMEDYPAVERSAAHQVLHGQLASGRVITGLDVTHKAWSLVGYGYATKILRVPLVRPVADRVYRLFARNRHRIAAVLTGQSRCQQCSIK